jgi:hypothetical protein
MAASRCSPLSRPCGVCVIAAGYDTDSAGTGLRTFFNALENTR